MRCPTLPARMMVGLHFIEDEPLFQPPRRGLYSLIFNSQEKVLSSTKKEKRQKQRSVKIYKVIFQHQTKWQHVFGTCVLSEK